MTTIGIDTMSKAELDAWEGLLPHLNEEANEDDERADFTDPTSNGSMTSRRHDEIGTDGDDSPSYARAKPNIDIGGTTIRVKLANGKTGKVQFVAPGDIIERVRMKPPRENPAGEMVADSHGFMVKSPRTPWKTPPRTNCAFCGDEIPKPAVSDRKYLCEFDPDASHEELALIGEDQPEDDADRRWWTWKADVNHLLGTAKPPCRHDGGCRCDHKGCGCSGCILRWQVLNGHERNVGQPKKYCDPKCKRQHDAEIKRWKRTAERAKRHGETPPPAPEDRGLRLRLGNRLRSAIEGSACRWTASTTFCSAGRVPRA